MRWSTHSAISLNSLWLFQVVAPDTVQASLGVLLGSALFGGLLPDLDAVDSKLQHLPIVTVDFQPFRLLARVIRRTSPHRGWMHSLRGLEMISVLLTPAILIFGLGGWIIFILGYASHLLADMMNPSGIPLFYPNPRRRHLVPKKWRISTGSPEEDLIFVIFACLLLSFLLRML